MDFLGLPGAKPMMPPPPKVCPPIPVLEPPKDDVVKEPVDEPEDELPPEALESELPVLPVPPEVSVELPGMLLGLEGSLGLPDAPGVPDPPVAMLEASGWHPPSGELEPMPKDELSPLEPNPEEPIPDEPNPEPEEPKPEPDEPNPEEPIPEEPKPEEPSPDALSPLAPQLVPMPPIIELVRGFPKNPYTVGNLFWPMRMGLHSFLPVVGSMYFLRRKRILLVLTSASTFIG